MAYAGKDHRHVVFVGGLDDLLVANRSAGLYRRSSASLRRSHQAVRKGEERVMERLMKGAPCVLSSGGGAFLSARTRELSKEHTLSIWIKADADVLAARTQGKKHRPLIPAEDNKKAIQKLIEKSYPLYALADMMVESCQEPPVQTVRKIIRLLQQSNFIQEL